MAIVTYSRDIDMMILSHREHINQLVESVRSTTQVALALKDQNLPDKVRCTRSFLSRRRAAASD